MSQPTNFRPSCFDATAVVPEPKPACLLRVGVSRPDIPYVKTYFRLVKAERCACSADKTETQSPDIVRPLEAIPLAEAGRAPRTSRPPPCAARRGAAFE